MSMSIQDYLDEMRRVRKSLLNFIKSESNDEENFRILNDVFKELKISEDQHKLMSLLHLLVKIANNHQRSSKFFSKIEQILLVFQSDINKYFLNSEIFNVFKSNKRILLFLIEQKIIIIDEYIVKTITTGKYKKFEYDKYFAPEIEPFKKDSDGETNKEEELNEEFYENRKIGENDNFICKLIQNDSIDDFIIYTNKTNLPLKSEIKQSIYETNDYLIKKQTESYTTLIEYTAFFGSLNIFNYLIKMGVELTPSIWNYAIHGKNSQIIRILEEANIKPTNMNECFYESIKCNHNAIAKYIQTNSLQEKDINLNDLLIKSLKFYNFGFIQSDLIKEITLYDACRYGYYIIADFLLKDGNIDINQTLKISGNI